jgi:hypothetical protein
MPLLWLSLAFLSGLLAANLLDTFAVSWTWPVWLALAGACLLQCLAIRRFIRPGWPGC